MNKEHVRAYCVSLCEAYHVPTVHAEVLVDSLLDADLRGKQTHGLVRLGPYLTRIRQGVMNASATPAIVRDTGPVIRVDGRNGIGAVVADFCVRTVMERALSFGVGMAVVDHSNHLGALGYWAMHMSEGGCFGVVVSDASPRLPPTGGIVGVVGNNPWSIAVPTTRLGFPVVMDMANSIAAAGKIRELASANKDMPEGWALNSNGLSTTDPAEALAGILLPMAGYKGYAIAFMLGLLTSGLSGAQSIEVRNVDSFSHQQDLSHLFLAINPLVVHGEDWHRLSHKVDEWVDKVHNCKKMPGVTDIFVPGEKSHRHYEDNFGSNGFNLSKSTLLVLNRAAQDVGHCYLSSSGGREV